MAYRLKYSDYPGTAEGPPDPERWVGPPGPPGPTGPTGPQGVPGTPYPEAPADGITYGRFNGTSWNGVLPLTGGTLTGSLTVKIYAIIAGTGGSPSQLFLDNDVRGQRLIAGRAAGATRWTILPGDQTAGEDFVVGRYSDAGGWVDNPLTISRSNGAVNFTATPWIAGSPMAFLPLTGGVMGGALTLAGDPTTALMASTRQYVDAQISSTNTSAALTYVPLSQRAAASGIATLDATGKIPTAQLPGSSTGTLSYKGGWNASTNTPTMASGALAGGVLQPIGNYYVVTASGTTAAIDGTTTWVAGDWIASNGTIWQRVVNSTSPYLPLTGGNLSGTLTTAGGASVGVLDPRIPDLPFAWQDAAGNVGATVSATGTLFWPSFQTNALTVSNVAATTINIGADRFGAGDPRIPDFVYYWQDASGNIAAGFDKNGMFNGVVANTVTKSYVDTTALLLAGGTMVGPLTLAGDPPAGANNRAATKGYVDQAVLNAGGSGPGTDPTFNSLNVNAGYYFGGQLLLKSVAQSPGAPGVPGIPNTHLGLAINSTGAGNVIIGYQSGGGQLTGGATMTTAENTYVGSQVAANHSGGGGFNVGVGLGVMRVDPAPQNTVSIGCDASRNSTNNLRSVFVGTQAGRNGNNLADLVYIGFSVGFGTDGIMPAVSNTVAIGSYALSDPNMGSANNSVFVGGNVAKKGQSVPGNLLLGPNVGSATLINGTGLIYLGASGAIDAATATENHTFRLGNHATNLMRATGINTASPAFFLDWLPTSTSYANDAAAATGGVGIGQIYRNGSAVQIRVA